MIENEVIVLDSERRFLEYTHPATARRLLKDGNAVIYSRTPFAIQLTRPIESPQRTDRNEQIMAQISNYTEFFKEERDIYVQNISGCQVTVSFEVSPGRSESHLFVNTKDPVNLTRFIPFAAVKSSMEFRRMLNRIPPALQLLDNREFESFYVHAAEKMGLAGPEEAMEKAEQKRMSIQKHEPLKDATDPIKIHEVVEDGQKLGEKKRVVSTLGATEEEINPRVLNLCLQVHPNIPDQQKWSAQQVLSELDNLDDLKLTDWEYLQSHGYYKSVRNLARKKVSELVSVEEPVAKEVKKAPKKSPKTTIQAE